MKNKADLRELAKLFLKLGITAFGGPAAHIAMMQKEVVQKRGWMDEQRFLDLVGAVNLIPGPNSTELAIHIGHDRAGWRGLVISGLCFILPAVFITGIFAWLYSLYGALPEIQPYLYGISPAIIAIILSAVYPLALKSLKNYQLVAIGLVVLTLALAGINEIILMFGAGFVYLLITAYRYSKSKLNTVFPAPLLATVFENHEINFRLFTIFLKIGAILYGSGYVLFAFLDEELVTTGLLTRQQLLDAIAVGQFTPGPVFSSVTFVGYQINGLTGAIFSTLGIFAPSFAFVALLNPIVTRMRNSKLMSAFLDAVNVASIAIILSVAYLMAKASVTDWRTITIALISLFVTFKYKEINSAFIVIGGAVTGYVLSMI